MIVLSILYGVFVLIYSTCCTILHRVDLSHFNYFHDLYSHCVIIPVSIYLRIGIQDQLLLETYPKTCTCICYLDKWHKYSSVHRYTFVTIRDTLYICYDKSVTIHAAYFLKCGPCSLVAKFTKTRGIINIKCRYCCVIGSPFMDD